MFKGLHPNSLAMMPSITNLSTQEKSFRAVAYRGGFQITDFGYLVGNKREDTVKSRMPIRFDSRLLLVAFGTMAMAMTSLAQSSQPAPGATNAAPQQGVTADSQGSPRAGTIHGSILDQSGAVVAGAEIKLTGAGQAPNQQVLSATNGEFSFANAAPGPFQLTITAAGFAPQTFSGVLQPGEIQNVPIALGVAEARTEVEVGVKQTEVAEEQIKIEEKQRVLGVIPNFYVTYVPNPEPLNPRQKFEIAWRSVIDPFNFVVVAGIAGVTQAQDHFEGYGQGAEGYGKRFGAVYADNITGTFIGGAILPSLLKQDPRYYYKGTGSKSSRFMYALANAVICKGDNGKWQTNYSNILGSLAAGGISNLYYPKEDRNGAGLTFENAAIGIGGTAIGNLFQEFVVKKLTPKLSRNASSQP